MSRGGWNLDKTIKSKYYLSDTFIQLHCEVLGSTIKANRIDNIKGEAHIVYDENDIALGFESNFTFDLSFVAMINAGQEVKGKISLSDCLLDDVLLVDSTAFQFTWARGSSGFSLHQAQGIFQSQRCRKALAQLHTDYIELCYTHFLHHNAPSLVLATDDGSLGLFASITTAAEKPPDLDPDEVDFDV